MYSRRWNSSATIVTLSIAALLLTGCPKKPSPAMGESTTPPTAAGGAPGAGSSDSGGGGAGAGAGSGPGTIGSGPGTSGSGGGAGSPGSGAAGGPGAAGPGVAGATGTTIPALPSPREFVETSALKDVFFDFDKYEIRRPDSRILEENAAWLKSNPNALLLIEGHCDERGTNEYNLALGERRAKATRDHLVSLGIAGGRITIISYGEERPTCADRNEACWAKNRRAHFLVKQ